MKRFFPVALISLTLLMPAEAMSETSGLPPFPEDMSRDLPPPPPEAGMPEELPGDNLDEPAIVEEAQDELPVWLENFTDPEGNMPEVTLDELKSMVPAQLTVKRVKQYETACQYWLRLENRLPFKIRNMALRFSAYILGKGYERPILYDTSTKSFSELRPTDVQYRDIFFEYADCAKLDFIKVEDAGRCSVGNLTKFSSQSGDCARFVEVKENDHICIYMDHGQEDLEVEGQQVDGKSDARRSPDNPCGLVSQGDVDDLLDKFKASYEAGDLTSFTGLFDEKATTNDGVGRKVIQDTYGELFRESKTRELKLGNRAWKPKRGGSAVIRFMMDVKIDRGGFWGPDEYQIEGLMDVYLRGERLSIASFLHQQKKSGEPPPLY